MNAQKEKYSASGNSILESIHDSDNFTDWMFEQIRPYLKNNIWEIGSGIGTYSRKVLRYFPNNQIVLSDIDKQYVDQLQSHFNLSNVKSVKVDICNKSDLDQIPTPINSAFALNVLEHVPDDVLALRNIYNKLAPGGIFVFLVPAHPRLFNSLDQSLDHYRRYSKREIVKKVAATDFKINEMSYFNFPAILGWIINGTILKRSVISNGQMSAYNTMVPIFRLIERYILRRSIGISLVAVLQK